MNYFLDLTSANPERHLSGPINVAHIIAFYPAEDGTFIEHTNGFKVVRETVEQIKKMLTHSVPGNPAIAEITPPLNPDTDETSD